MAAMAAVSQMILLGRTVVNDNLDVYTMHGFAYANIMIVLGRIIVSVHRIKTT